MPSKANIKGNVETMVKWNDIRIEISDLSEFIFMFNMSSHYKYRYN